MLSFCRNAVATGFSGVFTACGTKKRPGKNQGGTA